MRKKHIIWLIIALLLLVLGVIGLTKLDDKIEMPLGKGIVSTEDKAVKEVEDMINSLSNPVTLQDEAAIKAARDAYNALDDEAKSKVGNLNVLEEKEKQLADLKAAKEVEDMINNIADCNDVDSIKKAREAYDNLTAEQKAHVTNLAVLEDLEKQAAENENKDLEVGAIVTFKGGNVYKSAKSDKVACTKAESQCKVTYTSIGSAHPYHLVSLDGKGVYGWVDEADISR